MNKGILRVMLVLVKKSYFLVHLYIHSFIFGFIFNHSQIVTVLLTFFIATNTMAVEGNTAFTCPKVNIWEDLINNIPFSEMNPIYIGGNPLGKAKNNIPKNASSKSVCACKNNVGIKEFGMVVGMWEPAFLIEISRTPFCSIVLGTQLSVKNIKNFNIGSNGSSDNSLADGAFFHVHVYSFPLARMLDLYTDLNCGVDDYWDLDLLYLSELDPSWNNEFISVQATPELKMLANKEMVSSCSIDVVAAFNNDINNELFHCAGSWGFLYPLTGYQNSFGGLAQNSSLSAARVLNILHRRNLIRSTVGDKALCGSYYSYLPDKSAYRFSMLYPKAENKSAHAYGAPVEFWEGDLRIPPGFHEVIYVVWRFKNCCLMELD